MKEQSTNIRKNFWLVANESWNNIVIKNPMVQLTPGLTPLFYSIEPAMTFREVSNALCIDFHVTPGVGINALQTLLSAQS